MERENYAQEDIFTQFYEKSGAERHITLIDKSGYGETGISKSVRTQSIKIVMYTMEPRLRASPRHGGQGLFELFVTDPPRGRPFGGGGNHRK